MRKISPGVALPASLGLVFILACLAWRSTLNTTFFALSADDFDRLLRSWQVAQGNILPSDLWPPLQFWVQALALKLFPGFALYVPITINLLASGLTLVCVGLLARQLKQSPAGQIAAILLAGSMVWFIWLGLSGLSEALYDLFIVLGYLATLAWLANGRPTKHLALASCAFGAACMTRFDGWGHTLIFSLVVFWMAVGRADGPRKPGLLLWAAAPWVFPIFWLAWQYALHGNPFWFGEVTRNYALLLQGNLSASEKFAMQFRNLLSIAGIGAPLGLMGAFMLRSQPGARALFLMWAFSLGFMVITTLNNAITMAAPTRVMAAHAILLAPCAAKIFDWLYLRRKTVLSLAATATLVAIMLLRLSALLPYPNGVAPDTDAIGRHMQEIYAQRGKTGKTLIEVAFWDYVIFQAYTGDPSNAALDRAPTLVLTQTGEHTLDDATNPSLFALPPAQLASELRRQSVHLVITNTERAAQALEGIADQVAQEGRYRIFWVRP